jgi:hypothetical protein
MDVYQPLRFRFISNATSAKEDDITTFTPVFTNDGDFAQFEVVEQKNIVPTNRKRKFLTTMCSSAFHHWFTGVMNFLEEDTEDPLEFVQIEMPLYPIVLVRPTQLRDMWTSIHNWVLRLQERGAWPKQTELETTTRPNNRHHHRQRQHSNAPQDIIHRVAQEVQYEQHQPVERLVRRHTFFNENGGMRVVAQYV